MRKLLISLVVMLFVGLVIESVYAKPGDLFSTGIAEQFRVDAGGGIITSSGVVMTENLSVTGNSTVTGTTTLSSTVNVLSKTVLSQIGTPTNVSTGTIYMDNTNYRVHICTGVAGSTRLWGYISLIAE